MVNIKAVWEILLSLEDRLKAKGILIVPSNSGDSLSLNVKTSAHKHRHCHSINGYIIIDYDDSKIICAEYELQHVSRNHSISQIVMDVLDTEFNDVGLILDNGKDDWRIEVKEAV